MGTTGQRMLIPMLAICSLAGAVPAQDDLAGNFATPPDSARPWVYTFDLSGNWTREGITADLEAMKRVGIGGFLLFEVEQNLWKNDDPLHESGVLGPVTIQTVKRFEIK